MSGSPMQESAPNAAPKKATSETDSQCANKITSDHADRPSKSKKKFFRRRKRTNSFKRRGASAWLHPFAMGQPVAPYNTTQFLMEDHKDELDEKNCRQQYAKGEQRRRSRGDSFNSVDSFGEDCQSSSFEDDEEFLQAQFSAVYDSLALERLHGMSKPELVQEYLFLETRVDELEEELKAIKKAEESDQPMEVQATEEDIAKITVFQQEITKLQSENRRLTLENDHLSQNANDFNSADVQ